MACIGIAYTIMTYMAMDYIVMAYIAMAYTVTDGSEYIH